MVKVTRKLLPLLIVLCMMGGIAFGCSSSSYEDDVPASTNQEDSTTQTPDSESGTVNASSTSSSDEPAKFDITTAPMPTRTLSNKTVKYYSWVDIYDQYGGKDNPNAVTSIVGKEFGMRFEGTIGTHDTYWDALATFKASGNSPDIVLLPSWNFYPRAITEGLLEPLDGLIDFSNPMWDDVRQLIEGAKMEGKTYIPYFGKGIIVWMFYNTKMFKDNGQKTPRDYYLEDNWTWDIMKMLADSFVQKNPDGTTEVYGVGFQTNDLIATTGIELVEADPVNGYKFNLKDPKVAKMMNLMYELGDGGTGALASGDVIGLFKANRLPMLGTMVWAANVDFNKMRLAGNLDWVPLPKMDKDTPYYNQVGVDPGWGIVAGAKNSEAAALFIEFSKWMQLGTPISSYLPKPDNAASIKYNIQRNVAVNPETQLTQEQMDWTRKFVDYPIVSNMWQSWLGTMSIPGYGSVLTGIKQWSAAVEEEYPVYDAVLKEYFKK